MKHGIHTEELKNIKPTFTFKYEIFCKLYILNKWNIGHKSY